MAKLEINNNHYLASQARAMGYEDMIGDEDELVEAGWDIVRRFYDKVYVDEYGDGTTTISGPDDEDNPLVIIRED